MKTNNSTPPALPNAENDAFPWRAFPYQQIKTAAQIFGCSPAKIYTELHAGELSAVKIAGRTLVTTESILALLKKAEAWTPRADISARVSAMRKGASKPAV